VFIDVFEAEAKKLAAALQRPSRRPSQSWIQGTLYPDVIESMSLTGTRR
jgi:GMP synthase PP-ATPase subunit